jgi:predicted Holliday junction resolvase-like endonuclease
MDDVPTVHLSNKDGVVNMLGVIIGLVIVVVVIIVMMVRGQKDIVRLTAELSNRDKLVSTLKEMVEQVKDKAAIREDKLREEYEVRLKAGIKTSREKQRSAIKGQIAETIAPFFKEFKWNPKDARFLGSPIDFVVFDGMSEGDIKEIVFVEVKAGTGALNKNQRVIRGKVLNGKVDFQTVRIKDGEKDSTEA